MDRFDRNPKFVEPLPEPVEDQIPEDEDPAEFVAEPLDSDPSLPEPPAEA